MRLFLFTSTSPTSLYVHLHDSRHTGDWISLLHPHMHLHSVSLFCVSAHGRMTETCFLAADTRSPPPHQGKKAHTCALRTMPLYSDPHPFHNHRVLNGCHRKWCVPHCSCLRIVVGRREAPNVDSSFWQRRKTAPCISCCRC